jgi:hypothetical protein
MIILDRVNNQYVSPLKNAFIRTWNGKTSASDEGNAMWFIKGPLESLLSAEILNDSAQNEVITYLERISKEMGNEEKDDNNLQEQILKDFRRFL